MNQPDRQVLPFSFPTRLSKALTPPVSCALRVHIPRLVVRVPLPSSTLFCGDLGLSFSTSLLSPFRPTGALGPAAIQVSLLPQTVRSLRSLGLAAPTRQARPLSTAAPEAPLFSLLPCPRSVLIQPLRP